MKKLRKIFGTVVLLVMLMAGTAYAQIPTIDSLPGHYNQSVLLKNGETTSQDKIESYERGTIFSAGMIQITNEQNGNLYISVDTAAHVKVDSIYQAVYLESGTMNQKIGFKLDTGNLKGQKRRKIII